MEPLHLKLREGKEYDIGTMTYRIKVRSSETGGLFSLIDFTAYPGAIGPGDHYHKNYSETYIILAGKLKLTLKGEEKTIHAGEIVFIPKGVIHDFSNPFDQPCRFLLQTSPGGLENFYEEAAESKSDEFADLLKQYQIIMA